MEILETLYDHYKDTCGLTNAARENRNKAFVLLCVLEALAFMFIFDSSKACNMILQTITIKLGEALCVGQGVLQTLLWILILYVFMRYCQLNTYVERQYTYLSIMEKELKKGKLPIDREGDYYNADYPAVLKIVDFMYKWFFSVLFLVIHVVRIIAEWIQSSWCTALLVDTLIAIAIIIIAISYIFTLHPLKKKK